MIYKNLYIYKFSLWEVIFVTTFASFYIKTDNWNEHTSATSKFMNCLFSAEIPRLAGDKKASKYNINKACGGYQ